MSAVETKVEDNLQNAEPVRDLKEATNGSQVDGSKKQKKPKPNNKKLKQGKILFKLRNLVYKVYFKSNLKFSILKI